MRHDIYPHLLYAYSCIMFTYQVGNMDITNLYVRYD